MKAFYLAMVLVPALLNSAHARGLIQINPGGSVDIDPDDGRTQVYCNAPAIAPPAASNGPECSIGQSWSWGQPTFNVLQTVVNGNSTQIKSLSSNDTTHSLDDAISSLRNLLDAGVCGRVTNHKCTFSQGYSFGNPVWQILVTITDGRSTQDSRMYYNGDQNDVLSHFRMLRDLGYCNQPVLAPPPALVVPVPQVATKVPAK